MEPEIPTQFKKTELATSALAKLGVLAAEKPTKPVINQKSPRDELGSQAIAARRNQEMKKIVDREFFSEELV
ncbi:hypothetical protein [Bradyrhizobium arachidis]|uniref:Uncharacterized protein n=1 Tax=Bradyrhizobium arachidis TaxID=858423 RepID=A0AAE7NJQ0_9BRAD|nr:hypothetical protein [Bradyrhizobium arachidis]QOZ66567.1 hypothetical protein WN72_09410 [Bradyrhizobium arachidis]